MKLLWIPTLLLVLLLAACGAREPAGTPDSDPDTEATLEQGFQPPQGVSSTSSEAVEIYNDGVELQEQGRLDEAIAQYGEAIRLNPQLFQAYFNREIIYAELGEYQRAIEDYDQAISIDPDLALAYANRAMAYIGLGENSEAQESVEQAVEMGFSRTVLQGAIEQAKAQR